MASLSRHQYVHCFCTPKFSCSRRSDLFSSLIVTTIPKKSRVLRILSRDNSNRVFSSHYKCKWNDEIGIVESPEKVERPLFDINLAVILAGFAFEAYWSPSENVGEHEVDAADCKTVYLSRTFLHEVYNGELVVKVIKGYDFPAMDPWGTSDPYVVLQLNGQVVKSNVKWGTKNPTWNEDLALNIKRPPTKNLEIAVWDANLVTPHKRMGNARVSLDCFCDGNLHEILLELEGMGGGGKIKLEVKYKSYDENDEVKKSWKVPFVGEFLRRHGLESAVETIVGSKTVQARQFAEYAFGQLKTFNEEHFLKGQFSFGDNNTGGKNLAEIGQSEHFWKNLADAINPNIVQNFGVSVTEKIKWDGFDLLNKMGSQSQKIADEVYIGSGLASPDCHNNRCDDDNDTRVSGSLNIEKYQSSLPDVKKATQDILRQTDSILGALMVLTPGVSQTSKKALDSSNSVNSDVSENVDNKKLARSRDSALSEEKSKEMKALFTTAESAMEAWAMLATSVGHPSFIKSEFEKLCFLDNPSTDTQVAVWRDSARKRLVIAFRGTEQVRWKDLRTDLMLAPVGLNPERIGSESKQEIQVHSGFLTAYDSVRTRLMPLIKSSVGIIDDDVKPLSKWHVYVTGHSLGGALSTLLALELSSSELVKRGAICVTMYNFGSPRVGNKWFAELYNENVLDSWRVINHRDIIPTIPRLMGYCHVSHPIYLAPQNQSVMEKTALLEDGYEGDVIGESTPDAIVTEFMKGEKELIEKLLHTEINIFRSIRDGTALMQHMEDFYYISLLESVRSSYQFGSTKSKNNEDGSTI